MYYYVGWQEGDLHSTMAQQYAGVETCVFLHTHQQSNRSANTQQKELKKNVSESFNLIQQGSI